MSIQADEPTEAQSPPRTGPSTFLREVLVGVVAAAGTVVAIFALTSGFFDQMTDRVADFAQLYGRETQKAEIATKELEDRNAEIFNEIEAARARLAETEEQTKNEVEKLQSLSAAYQKEAQDLQSELAALRNSLKVAQDEADIALKNAADAGTALEGVKTRIAQIDSQAADAPKALNQFQDLVQTLQQLEDQGEQTIRAIVESEVFQDKFSQSLLPSTAVIAVDSPRGCPAGWREMEDARGRMILGANPNGTHQYMRRPFRGVGGEEVHRLSIEEMPEHTHDLAILTIQGDGLRFRDAGDGANAPYFTRSSLNLGRTRNGTYPAGGNEPHNNMPPYIALYFCKKEG